jgi:glycosyltransferase involved in cell wall biosynthesis
MKRLILLNRFFFPDQSATSQILSDLAFCLAERGYFVHIITSRQLYEDPTARLPAQETVRGVTVHRVLSTRFGRKSLVGRAIDYLSYYASMTFKIIKLTRSDDIIIAKTDPPLISVVAMWAARLRHATLINWLQDVYPEIAVATGIPFVKGPIGSVLSVMRDASLKSAAANVAVGNLMADWLRSSSIRVHVIPNWCDDEEIVPVTPSDNPLRGLWDLQHKIVIGYSGNLGRGHEFDTLLAAAERIRDNAQIEFIMIGGGFRFDELKQLVKAKGLGATFRFFPYQERKLLKYALSVPDIHWISLQPALNHLMFPSKFYGIAAVGRPMLAITGKQGEIADLVRAYDCGFAIEPGDVTAAADAIALLAQDHARREKMGLNARAMLDSQFTRRRSLAQWKELLDGFAKT